MNSEFITYNEVINDGRMIHLYREERTGLWIAFGYSAYLIANRTDVASISSFSDELQMPSVALSASAREQLIQTYTSTSKGFDKYDLITCEERVDVSAYQDWVKSIK